MRREWPAIEWAHRRVRDLMDQGLSEEDVVARLEDPAALRGMLYGEMHMIAFWAFADAESAR